MEIQYTWNHCKISSVYLGYALISKSNGKVPESRLEFPDVKQWDNSVFCLEIIVAAAAVVATLAVMDDVVDAREVYIYLFMGAVAFMTVSWGMSIGFFSCADENIYCCCC